MLISSLRSHLMVSFALLALAISSCTCDSTTPGVGDGSVALDGSVIGGDGGPVTSGDGGPVKSDGGTVTQSDGGDSGDAGLNGPADAGECPQISCEGQCGPIRDFCRGVVKQCGGCTSGLVCNLVDHRCAPPALTCSALGAQCGQIRNSCGSRLNCGACTNANQECDRNTHTCVACSNASCSDLGYECGPAWLGCGPFANTTNCGGCGTGSTCNVALHKCEPQCTPASTAVICAAAGATCGLISNGCGGMVSCGDCPSGQACGARGIGNRCDLPEVPDECLAAYRNCGTLQSACGNGMISCGTCLPGEVCGVEGRCTGDPTCASYGASGQADDPCSNGPSANFPGAGGASLSCPCSNGAQCNLVNTATPAPAGIKGECCVNTVVCNPNECNRTKINECTGVPINCGCMPGSRCNNATHVCTTESACDLFTDGGAGSPCSNAPSSTFPNDAGGFLACPCSAPGAACFSGTSPVTGSMSGTCCVPDECPANSCGSIVDHCTGQTKPCTCNIGAHCNTMTNQCVGDSNCGTYGANGAPGSVCSNGQSFSNNGTPEVLFACPCAGNATCSSGGGVVSGSTRGTCCVNTVTCGNQCNVTLTNSCTGGPINCGGGCGGTGTCSSGSGGTCTPYLTCNNHMPPANGSPGAPCSTSANVEFPRFPGDTTGQICNCGGGAVCSVSSPMPHAAGAGEVGTCCVNTASCGNTCGGSVINTCTGVSTQCTCQGATHCVGGTCAADKQCSDYAATGAVGSVCSNAPNTSFPGGPGGQDLTCLCNTGGGFANVTCNGATGSTPGTCGCTPRTAMNCGDNGQSDGCGGTLSSLCTGPNQVCFQNACCTATSCPAGNAGDACGTISNQCGGNNTCNCTAMYQTCGAVTAGVCGCKPKTLADCGVTLPAGQTSANGCGGFVTCPG